MVSGIGGSNLHNINGGSNQGPDMSALSADVRNFQTNLTASQNSSPPYSEWDGTKITSNQQFYENFMDHGLGLIQRDLDNIFQNTPSLSNTQLQSLDFLGDAISAVEDNLPYSGAFNSAATEQGLNSGTPSVSALIDHLNAFINNPNIAVPPYNQWA